MPGRLEPRTGPSHRPLATPSPPWPRAPGRRWSQSAARSKCSSITHRRCSSSGVLPFPEGLPHVLKFSSTGELLLAGGGHVAESGRVIVWNVNTGERIFEMGDELDAVLAADISADQSRSPSAGRRRSCASIPPLDGKLLNEFKKHTDWIYSISFSPDGVSPGHRRSQRRLMSSGKPTRPASISRSTPTPPALRDSPGASIPTCSPPRAKTAPSACGKWRTAATSKAGPRIPGATAVEFTREGNLVSCGRDKVTRLWDQNGAQQREFPALADIALKVTYCDETKRVITGDWSGEIRVWNAADGANRHADYQPAKTGPIVRRCNTAYPSATGRSQKDRRGRPGRASSTRQIAGRS